MNHTISLISQSLCNNLILTKTHKNLKTLMIKMNKSIDIFYNISKLLYLKIIIFKNYYNLKSLYFK